jgi:Planctomycete cytochrome C
MQINHEGKGFLIMRPSTSGAWLLAAICLSLFNSATLLGAVTPEHRKQADEVRKELAKVQGLIGKKEVDKAEEILSASEKKLAEIVKQAGIDESHKLVASMYNLIAQKRAVLARDKARKQGGGAQAGATFEKQVAPILVARCLNCHGEENPRGSLRLDTFAGITRGGASGRLVVPGNPGASLLVQRISATGDRRMPKQGEALTPNEIKSISGWIAAGAKFGGDPALPIEQAIEKGDSPKKDEPVVINKPSGNETVSFTKDIAPFMVNLCLGCHRTNGPGFRQTGFSIETFEKLMKGGRGGRVVVAGNLAGSRLWQLAGEQDPIKMPPGQSLITRSNHRNLKTWIEEGAKFDGPDPKAPLASLIPTESEKKAKALSALSPEEFARRRQENAAELWQSAFATAANVRHETEELFLIGDVDETRIKEIAARAEEDLRILKRTFHVKESPVWRGRLVVYVFKESFSYSEFVQTAEKREAPTEVQGHARVTPLQEEAYIAYIDGTDAGSESESGARALQLGLLAEALLLRSEKRYPDWVLRGTGMALAARADAKNPYFREQAAIAAQTVGELNKPQDLFENGMFAPDKLLPVAYTLAAFLLKEGGDGKYQQLLAQLAAGKSQSEALRTVYGAELATLSTAYQGGLPGAKRTKKNRK